MLLWVFRMFLLARGLARGMGSWRKRIYRFCRIAEIGRRRKDQLAVYDLRDIDRGGSCGGHEPPPTRPLSFWLLLRLSLALAAIYLQLGAQFLGFAQVLVLYRGRCDSSCPSPFFLRGIREQFSNLSSWGSWKQSGCSSPYRLPWF